MSRPRFFADHDFNEHIIDGSLRRESGVEVARVRDYGLSRETDAVVLEFAASNGFLLLSHDVNTMPAAAYARIEDGHPMPGLLMVRQSAPIARIIDDLILIWSSTDMEEWREQVWFLPL